MWRGHCDTGMTAQYLLFIDQFNLLKVQLNPYVTIAPAGNSLHVFYDIMLLQLVEQAFMVCKLMKLYCKLNST
jgi:hypothetical protein